MLSELLYALNSVSDSTVDTVEWYRTGHAQQVFQLINAYIFHDWSVFLTSNVFTTPYWKNKQIRYRVLLSSMRPKYLWTQNYLPG